MLNIFEQPWTLMGGAIIVLFVVLTVRSVWPEKRHFWQWCLPILVGCAGFGLDALVQTNMEKVKGVMNGIMAAARDEDCQAIGRLIAEDYSDSYHGDKADLMVQCRRRLSEPLISKIKISGNLIELKETTALATVFGAVHFEESSYVARDYRAFVYFKVQFNFTRQADGDWLINRIEIREIDKQPFHWGAW